MPRRRKGTGGDAERMCALAFRGGTRPVGGGGAEGCGGGRGGGGSRSDAAAAGGFGALEVVLQACGGRPHWGKLHTATEAYLAEVHPCWDAFRALCAGQRPRMGLELPQTGDFTVAI